VEICGSFTPLLAFTCGPAATTLKGFTRRGVHFSFSTTWGGGCLTTAGAGARWPEGRQTHHCFLPGRSPKLASPFEPARILPAASIRHPTAQPFLPPLRTPIDPPFLAFPQIDRHAGPPFPARSHPPAVRAPSVPASTRGHGLRLKAGFYSRPANTRKPTSPNNGMRIAVNPTRSRCSLELDGRVPPPPHTAAASRRTPCAAANPTRRLRTDAPFAVDVAGDRQKTETRR